MIMRWVKRAILVVLALGLIALLISAFRPKPVPVEVAKVARGDFEQTVDEDGRTRVKERYVVSSPVNGHLARITRRAGDAIEVNDVLATVWPLAASLLDDRSRAELQARVRGAEAAHARADAAVERAQALLEFNRKELARIKALADSGSLTGRELERAELEHRLAAKDVEVAKFGGRVADYELEVARAALVASSVPTKPEVAPGAWSIRSPVRGRVLRVLQASEGVVTAGTTLMEVADPSMLEVVVDVLTSDAVRISPGARTLLDSWGGPEVLEARVRTIEPSARTKISALGVEEQRVDVVLDLLSPYERWTSLGDGFRVHARMSVFSGHDATKAPSAALFREGDTWALFVVSGGRAAKRKVGVERRNAFEAVIAFGVQAGDTVVVHPSTSVADGVTVAVR
jgi:HlyD family secretion protein